VNAARSRLRATDWAFAAAGLHDFRRHDVRHTFASRLGRAKGDWRTLQKALDHSDISSSVRYRHVMESEATAARATVTVLRSNVPNMDRGKSDQGAKSG
jgi:site-specific recombinase XerD